VIVVAGHWDIGYLTPIIEHYRWALPLRDFDVDEWAMCPVAGILNTEKSRLPLREFPDYEAMLTFYADLPRVFLEPRTPRQNPATTWLHEFTHPTDALYVLGSAHYNPTIQHARDGDTVVSVKTARDGGVLWSPQVATLALYDRQVKLWQ
jgi:hypothetical protein